MKESPKTVTIDGVTFELRPNVKNPTNPDWVCLRKTPIFVDRYRALEKEFKGCNMVEVGVDQGGGTSFFLKHFEPRRLLAIELSKEPVTTLTDFLAEHDRDQRVTVHWGVDQADTVAVPRIVDETFADQPLDIVVDDASHLLQETTTTFEMLFPRLRQKGVYIIEDWSSTHLLEGRLELDAASNPDGGSAAMRAATPELNYQLPMSYLICQLLIASARNPEWISSINAGRGICAIRRGIADIEPGTPISSYVGDIGRWMLDKSVV
jgi:Methyltransferase domain